MTPDAHGSGPAAFVTVRRLRVWGLLVDPMYLDGYREKIVAWVQEGLSDRVIAERVRVSPSTVRYWRERNGVIRPPRGTGPEPSRSEPSDPA